MALARMLQEQKNACIDDILDGMAGPSGEAGPKRLLLKYFASWRTVYILFYMNYFLFRCKNRKLG